MDPREWLFDKRVVRRNLDKGVLTMKAYREYLKGTPNLDGEYEVLDLAPEEKDVDGEIEDGAVEASEEKAD